MSTATLGASQQAYCDNNDGNENTYADDWSDDDGDRQTGALIDARVRVFL